MQATVPPRAPTDPRRRRPDDKTTSSRATARPSTLLALAISALSLELALQGDLASVAGLVAVVAALALIWPRGQGWSLDDVFTTALTFAVATNLVLRTSPWVITPTALVLAGLLVLGAHGSVAHLTGRRAGAAVAAYGRAFIDAVPFVMIRPIRLRLTDSNTERSAIGRGLAVAAAVALLLTLLLANGDVVFGSLLGTVGGASFWSHAALFVVCALPLAALAATDKADDQAGTSSQSRRGSAPLEALMGLGAMATVLGAWSATQVAVRLGGADRLLATENLTRAQYARRGFFELVIVVAVVVTLLGVFGHLVGAVHRRWALGLSLVVAVQTVILVGVTYTKLVLYTDAFGLTMLRLAVAWFLAWLAVVVVVTAIRLIGARRSDRPWALTALLTAAAIGTVGFGWSNPEEFVVHTNVSHAQAGAQLDLDYLATLGSDAAPTIVSELPDSWVAQEVCARPGDTGSYGPIGWNLNRARAAELACRPD